MRAVLLAVLAVPLALAGPAQAATQVVPFDDLPANTRVSTEYNDSKGVSFPGQPGTRPLVKTFPGKAHSGDRVGVFTCEGLSGCGEGFGAIPRLSGVLKNSANSMSAYVGYWMDPMYPSTGTLEAKLVGLDVNGMVVAESAYVSVNQDEAITKQVSVTAPAGKVIDAFEVVADKPADRDKLLAIDDVAVTIDEAAPPPPPKIRFKSTGTSTEVPVSTSTIVWPSLRVKSTARTAMSRSP